LDLLDLLGTGLPDHRVCRDFKEMLDCRVQLVILDLRAYKGYKAYRG
jgi:hypothetical protein